MMALKRVMIKMSQELQDHLFLLNLIQEGMKEEMLIELAAEKVQIINLTMNLTEIVVELEQKEVSKVNLKVKM